MKLDPRSKLFIVVLISSTALLLTSVLKMLILFILGILISKLLDGHFISVVRKLKRMLTVIVVIIILQSIFNDQGQVIVSLGSIRLLTDVGLTKGLLYLFRVLIILVSGTILATSNETELIEALIKLKVPYDFAFMVALGIRFMPIFIEEFKDTMVAIELRGVDIRQMKLKEKLDLYGYILSPVIIGTLDKAEKLSLSIEMRGFRSKAKRTSHLRLYMKRRDYLVMIIGVGIIFVLVQGG